MSQPDQELPSEKRLPTMYDLSIVAIEKSRFNDEFHTLQPRFLTETFQTKKYTPEQMFVAGDLNYYEPGNVLWCHTPDWYVVVDKASRIPLLIVELPSPETEKSNYYDKLDAKYIKIPRPTPKWEIYEEIVKVPYYVIYDRDKNQLRIFRHNGTIYQDMVLAGKGFWIEELELGLGVWEGSYEEKPGLWLRWYDVDGWILTRMEKIEEQTRLVAEERKRADEWEMKFRILAQKLRELNIDPDSL